MHEVIDEFFETIKQKGKDLQDFTYHGETVQIVK